MVAALECLEEEVAEDDAVSGEEEDEEDDTAARAADDDDTAWEAVEVLPAGRMRDVDADSWDDNDEEDTDCLPTLALLLLLLLLLSALLLLLLLLLLLYAFNRPLDDEDEDAAHSGANRETRRTRDSAIATRRGNGITAAMRREENEGRASCRRRSRKDSGGWEGAMGGLWRR